MAPISGFTVWLTGMSGTGKTTLANYIAARLRQVGRNVEVLDEAEVGDVLCQGLGETKDERITVMRRLGYVADLLTRNGTAVLVASVSPYKGARDEQRKRIARFIEVYVDCPTEKLIQRDSTGKYKKALAGEIPNFIGITEPYEPPSAPEVTIHSDQEGVEESGLRIFQSLLDLGCVNTDELKIITGKKMKANPVKKARTTKESKARPAARSTRESKPKKVAAKRKGR